MTTLAALGLIFLGAIGGWVWRMARPQGRGAWLGATATVTLAFLLGVLFPPGRALTLSLKPWPLPGVRWPPLALQVDDATWPWALLTLSLGLAVMWAAVRYAADYPASAGWSGLVFVVGLLTMGMLAANPQTLLWIWVWLDLLILGLAMRGGHPGTEIPRSVALAWARSVSWVGLLSLPFLSPHRAALILTLAVGWRLLWQPWEALGDRCACPAYGLGVLLRLGNVLVTVVGLRFLDFAAPAGVVAGALVGALLYSVLWAVRPAAAEPDFLGPALGGLALAAALKPQPWAVWAWAAAVVLLGVPHRLGAESTAARLGWALAIPALMQWPRTPGAPLTGWWAGLSAVERLLLSGSLFALGLGMGMRWASARAPLNGEARPESQRWMRVLLPLSMLLPALGVYRWSVTAPGGGLAWGTLAVPLGAVAGAGLIGWLRRWPWLQAIPARAPHTSGVGRWPGKALWAVYRTLSRTLLFIAALLEGEGGLLWAVVLLVILILWWKGG